MHPEKTKPATLAQIAIAFLSAATFQTASAQMPVADHARPTAETQKRFDQYVASHGKDGSEDAAMLASVHSRGLYRTPDNVKTVRALLAARATTEVKTLLIRILAGLHAPDNPTGLNGVIERDLRALCDATDTEVARAAVFAVSRLGYFRDSADVLLRARNRGLLGDDGYYGELAHLIWHAPAHEQPELISRISRGRNKYASEILAASFVDMDGLKKLFPETRKALLASLEENEPVFERTLGVYDLIDAIRYTNWLRSVALLHEANGGASYNNIILARLNDEKTDPRKIMAFLSSSEGKAFIQSAGRRAPFEHAFQRVSLYSRQLPQNMLMKEAVAEINGTLGALKN